MKKIIPWKIFFILLTMSLISVILIFPYILTLQSEVLQKTHIPAEVLFFAQFFQSIIVFSLVIFLGLFFSKKIHFRMPFQGFRLDRDIHALISTIGKPVLFGILTACSIYLLDYFFSALGVKISTHVSIAPVWQKLLAAFYGGIAEEIFMRLFFMTFLIWVMMKFTKQQKPGSLTIWIGIILAAVIFGLGHLPITSTLTDISGLVIARAIVLNGIGGIVFGYLYWKKGLESAMISHFTADIFLLTLLPLLFT